jgi:hypothetical protein
LVTRSLVLRLRLRPTTLECPVVLLGLGDARVLTDACVNIEIEIDGICKLVKFLLLISGEAL